jgi:hypothetical protein
MHRKSRLAPGGFFCASVFLVSSLHREWVVPSDPFAVDPHGFDLCSVVARFLSGRIHTAAPKNMRSAVSASWITISTAPKRAMLTAIDGERCHHMPAAQPIRSNAKLYRKISTGLPKRISILMAFPPEAVVQNTKRRLADLLAQNN